MAADHIYYPELLLLSFAFPGVNNRPATTNTVPNTSDIVIGSRIPLISGNSTAPTAPNRGYKRTDHRNIRRASIFWA